MRGILRMVAGVALGAVVSGLPAAGWSQERQDNAVDERRGIRWPSLITVNGEGEVRVRPEEAVLRFGVEAQADEAAAAQAAVSESMDKVIRRITALRVSKSAMQTAAIHLTPVYRPAQPGKEAEVPDIAAYRASNTLQVRVERLEQVGAIIDEAIRAGANRLEGISFGLRDRGAHEGKALAAASKEAQNKARVLAEACGVELGPIYKIQTGVVSPPQPMRMEMMAAGGAPVRTPVEPGELTVSATVTIQYEIAGQSGLGGSAVSDE